MSDLSFEVHREDPYPQRIGVVSPGPGEFTTELAFQLIGRDVGWQRGEVRRDMTFVFELYKTNYRVHVTTDDTSEEYP